MSRWDLPVPESPIRQSGSPAVTQAPVARGLMVAGVIAGVASKSKSSSHFCRGEARGVGAKLEPREPLLWGKAGGLAPPCRPAAVTVVAFGEQQLGEESA